MEIFFRDEEDGAIPQGCFGRTVPDWSSRDRGQISGADRNALHAVMPRDALHSPRADPPTDRSVIGFPDESPPCSISCVRHEGRIER
jgi:hypothetical protein